MAETNEGFQTQSGWYKHKETDAVVELINDPEFGTPLTNAFVQAGYVYVGDTDPRVAPKEDDKKVVSKADNKK